MSYKSLKQVIDELERLAEAKNINLDIYDKLMSKLQNEDYFYTDEEHHECMAELHSLVSKKLLEKETVRSIENILGENEEKHANETSYIIKSIVSKSKVNKDNKHKLTSKKKALFLTMFTYIFGWIYCLINGDDKCKKTSNYVFLSETLIIVVAICIIVPVLLLG